MFKKVRKIWSKTGSPKVHILTLKASLEPSFFGTLENRCVKRPRSTGMCPTRSNPHIPPAKIAKFPKQKKEKKKKKKKKKEKKDICFSSLTNGKALRAIKKVFNELGPLHFSISPKFPS